MLRGNRLDWVLGDSPCMISDQSVDSKSGLIVHGTAGPLGNPVFFLKKNYFMVLCTGIRSNVTPK